MAAPPLASCPHSSPPTMDPFIHPFAFADLEVRQSTTWSGRALFRGLRRRLSLPNIREEKKVERVKIPARDPNFVIPAHPSANVVVSEKRKSFHRDRSTSRSRLGGSVHGRKLSVIPETTDFDDFSWMQPLTPTNTDPEQPAQIPRASLLGMPRELRDMICAHVFSDWTVPNPLSLLRTCHQIHEEATQLAFRKSLFRIKSEHWPDQEFFQMRHLSAISPPLVSSIRHLALRMPRGVPYDCYPSRHLHVNLAELGLRLESLILYSHMPRPLPHISEYGGVLETNLCLWLKQTLYTMPSLKHICILNYESQTPTLHDMPSPRLVRMLRSSIFKDVMAECQTLSEKDFQWRCLTDSLESSMSNCTADEKAYHVYSSKLSRSVEVVFQSDLYLPAYNLGHVLENQPFVELEKLLQHSSMHPDLPMIPYAGLLARKNSKGLQRSNTGRKRLSKPLIVRQQSEKFSLAPRPALSPRPVSYPAPPVAKLVQSPTAFSKILNLRRRFNLSD